jgi:tetratricopeptide (TPR) repeat protein
MTENKPPPPSPLDTVKQTTETLASFAQWVAELIRRRNWFTLLLLLDAGLILFGKLVAQFLANLFSFELPKQFSGWLWLTVGLIFVAAIIVAVVTMPRPEKGVVEFKERKAIKGLRPFTREDWEVFARLQRERMLRECLEALTHSGFRFGVLYGESGCGKTSFLQAGLWYRLSQENSSELAVYIRFSDAEPLETVRKALIEQLHLNSDRVQNADFLTLVGEAAATAKKPIILFFDQFEQFFVHRQQKTDRESFLNGLAAWFKNPDPPAVKILFSIRADLYHNLVEIQQALGYSPSPQEIFPLAKFTPTEATSILRAIAAIEELQFEEKFIQEVAANELASKEDGLISPVDLQILAWMIEKQSEEELRAFNRLAFQKFGGIEGLLTRFLERTLEARVTSAERQAALKVLLALTDLDRGVRAGLLTLEAIQDKVKATVSAAEVQEATEWLVRGDVRLITPVKNEQDQLGYELAHEKIIPALRRVAGKELSEVDRANQLLDRRVNEWLGNQRNSRYLLSLGELWFIERQKPYLVWGTNQPQKKQLIKISKRRYYRILSAIGALLLVFIGIWAYLVSPLGQIWRFQNELAHLSIKQQVNAEVAAIAFAKNNDWQKAEHICAEKISSPIDKAKTLTSLAEIADKLAQPQKASKLLQLALDSANQIQNAESQAYALRAIAEAYGKLGKDVDASKLLQLALDSANQIQAAYSQAEALRAIAEAYGKLGKDVDASKLLQQAIDSAKQIQDADYQADALRAIAEAIGKLGKDVDASKLLQLALDSANQIQDAESQAEALRAIAEAIGKLGKDVDASKLLQLALDSANQIQDSYFQAYALRAIAEAYGKLGKDVDASKLLQLALDSANQIQDAESQAYALRAIALAHVEISKATSDPQLLSKALDITKKISERDDILTAIAQVRATQKNKI